MVLTLVEVTTEAAAVNFDGPLKLTSAPLSNPVPVKVTFPAVPVASPEGLRPVSVGAGSTTRQAWQNAAAPLGFVNVTS